MKPHNNWPQKLTFKVRINKGGWIAQCIEVSGIITGTTDPKPSKAKIRWWILDAVRCAMAVRHIPRGQKIIIH